MGRGEIRKIYKKKKKRQKKIGKFTVGQKKTPVRPAFFLPVDSRFYPSTVVSTRRQSTGMHHAYTILCVYTYTIYTIFDTQQATAVHVHRWLPWVGVVLPATSAAGRFYRRDIGPESSRPRIQETGLFFVTTGNCQEIFGTRHNRQHNSSTPVATIQLSCRAVRMPVCCCCCCRSHMKSYHCTW